MLRRPWLPQPPRVELPVCIVPELLGPVAYQALLRDHVTRRVRGELTIPADIPTTPEIRAVALAALVPARGVVGRHAAVWIHTGCHPPGRVAVLVGPRVRRPDPHPDRTTHECELPASDVVRFGDVRVTSVQRTGIDVARWFPAEEALELMTPLVEQGFDVSGALVLVGQLGGYAGIRDARTTLARLSGRLGAQARITGCSTALAPVSR